MRWRNAVCPAVPSLEKPMSVSAAPVSARRAAERVGGPRRARGPRGARVAGTVLAVALLAFGLAAPRAQAQASAGQIYIPGPGERAAPNAANSAPSAGVAAASAESANGMITIPGPGEARAAQGNNGAMPVVVTQPPRPARAAQPISVEPPAGVSFAPQATRSAPAPARPAAAQPVQSAQPAQPVQPAQAAQPVPAGQQDGESIRRAALAFLQQQTVGLPGKISVTVAPAFPRGLAACSTLSPFMPPNARLRGRTTVGVRCAGEHPWTIYLQARVALVATYYLAARQIEPGILLTAEDLTPREGDLANLPQAVITDPSQAVGAVALARIGSGMLLRQDMLKSATSVTIGQTVRVVAVGQGFTISSEGSVMNNASPGQQVRVKTSGGQIISGTVKDGSTVEIQM
ncbi:flagellar basal body P-ring formation protein FlgA [Trinickia fusca]|uniref:Flagellar basal body P-ring formation protein FlgA n=2 Tax=Trinickia fusca TaxID=2419777 RepID=A0A494X103_9BURK|nr:flagellar basal body P-ring formation protein FlgA [Trinickia fusca]